MIKKLFTYLAAVVSLTIANSIHAANPLTPEEQALFDRNLIMETYVPTKHSGHEIGTVKAQAKGAKSVTVLVFNFGIEDAEPAREEGKSMAEFNYTPAMAEQFLFAQGWDKYHDRFFTRAYVQEGLDAYSRARRTETEPSMSIPQGEQTLQKAWDALPAWKQAALRAEERRWIELKDSARGVTKLQMIRDRTAYLLNQ
jgi:hypothetical protein